MSHSDDNLRFSVQPREIKFYYLTASEISSLKINTIVGDVFFLAASVLLSTGLATSTARAVTIVGGTVCLLVAILFYYLRTNMIRNVTSERSPTAAVSETTTATSSQSSLVSAVYGANETWLDITDRVREALRAGGVVIVSNGLAGRDPLENVGKYLRVVYTVNGEKFTKDFPESSALELPAGVI